VRAWHAARAGFEEEVGLLRGVGRKFGRWLDLLFMQKLLTGRCARMADPAPDPA
jgi:L-amino acid N-acyltransferase YncA